jgi:hypothetical protein
MMIQRPVAETKAKVAFACALIAATIRQVEQTSSFALRYFRNAPVGLHAGSKQQLIGPRLLAKSGSTGEARGAQPGAAREERPEQRQQPEQ